MDQKKKDDEKNEDDTKQKELDKKAAELKVKLVLEKKEKEEQDARDNAEIDTALKLRMEQVKVQEEEKIAAELKA